MVIFWSSNVHGNFFSQHIGLTNANIIFLWFWFVFEVENYFGRKWYFNKKISQGFDNADMAVQFLNFYYKNVSSHMRQNWNRKWNFNKREDGRKPEREKRESEKEKEGESEKGRNERAKGRDTEQLLWIEK